MRPLLAFLFCGSLQAATLTLDLRHDLTHPDIRVSRLDYLVSEPRLLQGTNWLGRTDWVGLVQVTESNTTLQLPNLPEGTYEAIQFTIGLDAKTDHSDPNQYPANHPLNPLRNNLHWTWQGTYIYLALEGYKGDRGFSYHLGNAPHRVTVRIPVALDLREDRTLQLNLSLQRMLKGLDVIEHPSTHGRPGDPVAEQLVRNTANAFRVIGTSASPHDAGKLIATSSNDLVGTPYVFRMPRHFPRPALPEDFPLTQERIALGKTLFHDPRLSEDGTISCASCHKKELAFADEQATSPGIGGRRGTRNSMSLFNLAWKSEFLWDGRSGSLREQALEPLKDPNEMHTNLTEVVAQMEVAGYGESFGAAFGDNAITPERIGIALEQFLLTLTSFNSRFDRAARGEIQLTPEEQRGAMLFFTEYDPRRELYGADCFHCHGGAFFSDFRFHNNGLMPDDDPGRQRVTGKKKDHNRFVTPSLRNVANTAPYMHDGRFATLEEVLQHYAGKLHPSPNLDPNLAKHPNGGVPISKQDQQALIAFLKALGE